jgi:hypothetical protein
VLALDRRVGRLHGREAHGAVAARAAVAADDDVSALDLAELVEERAKLLRWTSREGEKGGSKERERGKAR